jgi:hypothetical protein
MRQLHTGPNQSQSGGVRIEAAAGTRSTDGGETGEAGIRDEDETRYNDDAAGARFRDPQ